MINILLFPLKLIYYMGVGFRNWCYDIGVCSKHTFDIPILSIGNIAFGGTGKTPLVIHLCEKLKSDKYHPAVISRGYKRKSTGLLVVNDGSGNITSVQDAGDEPYLISKKLNNIPVVVCKQREKAAEYIINNFSDVNVIVMDDGFQYRKLDRTADIVLLGGSECCSILREPKSSLKRADIVLSLDKQYSICSISEDKLTPSIPDESVYVFCGVANSEPFINFIKDKNIDIKGQSIFNDHHEYSDESIRELSTSINKSGANSIITTEKDLVKLSADFLKQYKVYVVTLDIILEDDIYNQIIRGINNS